MNFYKLKNINKKKLSFIAKSALSAAFLIQASNAMEGKFRQEGIPDAQPQQTEVFDYFAGETLIKGVFCGDDTQENLSGNVVSHEPSQQAEVFDYFAGEAPIIGVFLGKDTQENSSIK